MSSGLSRTITSSSKSADYLLYTTGALIPLIFGVYWPLYALAPDATSLVLRPVMLLIALTLAVMCGYQRISTSEATVAKIFALLCVTRLCTTLTATDVERAMEGWVKVLALCLFALFLARALRTTVVAKAFGLALIACSVLISAFTVAVYVRLSGFTIPTYDALRHFKALALNADVPLNGVPVTAAVSYLAGMCLTPANRFTRFWGAGLLIIGSGFTGSRTPLAVSALCGLGVLLAKGMQSRRVAVRYQAFAACVIMIAGALTFVEKASFKKMSDLTEGRWDLWYVAVQKFSERPLTGWGFGSIDDDLYVRMPNVYKIPQRKGGKFTGGYHNEYLHTLAEEGLIGFVALVALYWFLTTCCWQLAFLNWQTWRRGSWALAGGLYLLFEAGDELPGLLGFANGPGDFLAYIFLALVVSRFSVEEDCARNVKKYRAIEQRAAASPLLARPAVLAS